MPSVSIDLRPCGKYLYCMRGAGADGVVSDIWGAGTYKEIVPQERLVYTDSFADENGNIVPASHYGMEGEFPLEMLVTLTFEDLGRRTGFTLRHAGIPEGEMIELTRGGWNESFDKLADCSKRTVFSGQPERRSRADRTAGGMTHAAGSREE